MSNKYLSLELYSLLLTLLHSLDWGFLHFSWTMNHCIHMSDFTLAWGISSSVNSFYVCLCKSQRECEEAGQLRTVHIWVSFSLLKWLANSSVTETRPMWIILYPQKTSDRAMYDVLALDDFTDIQICLFVGFIYRCVFVLIYATTADITFFITICGFGRLWLSASCWQWQYILLQLNCKRRRKKDLARLMNPHYLSAV